MVCYLDCRGPGALACVYRPITPPRCLRVRVMRIVKVTAKCAFRRTPLGCSVPPHLLFLRSQQEELVYPTEKGN